MAAARHGAGENSSEHELQPLTERERKSFIGGQVRKLRKTNLRTELRWRQRQRHWSYIDLWNAVHVGQGFYCEPDQIRRVEGGTAPLDPEFVAAIFRALGADAPRTALASHASRGEGAILLLLQKLGVLDAHLATCRNLADQAIRGLITEAEYGESVEALAEIIALDLVRRHRENGRGEIDSA